MQSSLQLRRQFLTFFLLMAFTSSCSIQKLAVKTTSGLFSYGIEALYAEPDLQIAETAIASNLKLLEGFHLADPDNKTIMEILTQGYAAYALGFLEDDQPERASRLYLRSKDYGFKLLQKTKPFKNGISSNVDALKQQLNGIKKSDVPALFWTAFSWAGWVNLNRDNPQAIFDLALVKAMMDRVLALDEGFFFGAAHLFWGSIDGSLPKLLGGDPEKAKNHFESSLKLSDQKFLITHVYYAKYYAATTLNETLFDELIEKVLAAPEDLNPGYELLTAIAKRKAQLLKDNKDEIL